MKITVTNIKYDTDGQSVPNLPESYEWEIDDETSFESFSLSDWREWGINTATGNSDWLISDCTVILTL